MWLASEFGKDCSKRLWFAVLCRRVDARKKWGPPAARIVESSVHFVVLGPGKALDATRFVFPGLQLAAARGSLEHSPVAQLANLCDLRHINFLALTTPTGKACLVSLLMKRTVRSAFTSAYRPQALNLRPVGRRARREASSHSRHSLEYALFI